MIFTETSLKGAYVIDLKKIADDRGFFARTYCRNEFAEHNLSANLVQANTAFSISQYTLRGLHLQVNPYAEAKLVRCIQGAVLDVIVDLRPESATFKQWFGVELSQENRKMLYVPENFAHGYLTLEESSEVLYLVSQYYSPESERGYRWNDPAFGIEWPENEKLIISDKDQQWPLFTD